MKFVSTRGSAPSVTFSEATLHGLAPDGGLYVPTSLPRVLSLGRLRPLLPRYPAFAAEVLRPFFRGDVLESSLDELCEDAFDFPVPLNGLEEGTAILELYHGPTAAFKDFGARFLAGCFERLVRGGVQNDLAILVATSGDTGSAVAAACHGREGMRVGVLFPKGGVSPRQERQLTCWDGNVTSFAVRGTFDDCQRVVKEAFRSENFEPVGRLTSANSINIGRLLPQMVYYAWASLTYREGEGTAPGFVVPSGNLGNTSAALWAKAMGFPVRHVAIATNANRVVPDWFETGEWTPRRSVSTLANAMDVGDPSNMERLFHLYPTPAEIQAHASALSVEDALIGVAIVEAHDGPDGRHDGRAFCPHTATALHFRTKLDSSHWIVVATAHPAKFNEIVEPLIQEEVEVPPQLATLLARPSHSTEIGPDVRELTEHWLRV